MEIASFELSKQLRDAGFPQPRPAEHQTWYTANGSEGFINHIESDGTVWVLMHGSYREAINVGHGVYAPTAVDVLKELPQGYGLFRHETELHGVMWTCHKPKGNGWEVNPLFETPIEAAIHAWTEWRLEGTEHSVTSRIAHLANEANNRHNKKS